jgi:hypothetical protein
MSAPARSRRSTTWQRFQRSDLALGLGLLAFGLLFVRAGSGPAEPGHGERAFLLAPALLLVAMGLGFTISGLAAWMHWPGGRRWRLAPLVVAPLVIVLAFAWLLWPG